MKKSIVFALLLLASAALRAEYFADIYVDPLGAVAPFDGIAAGFEWSVLNNDSLRLQARLNGRADYPAPAESRNVAAVEAGFRFFFSETRRMQGFFLGPIVGVGMQNDIYTDRYGKNGVYGSGTYYKAGLEFGHQWILGRGFVLTPGIIASFIPEYVVGVDRPAQGARIYGGLELNLGWAFSR